MTFWNCNLMWIFLFFLFFVLLGVVGRGGGVGMVEVA